MAVAAKSPRAVLMLYLERRKALAGKVGELEEALPVVADVVALMKEKKAVVKELEGLKKRRDELRVKREGLELERRKYDEKSSAVERKIAEYEKAARELAKSGEGGKEELPQRPVETGGAESVKGTPQPLMT